MDREIKVTKCGEQEECELSDRISIEFAPYEVSSLKYIFFLRRDETRESLQQDSEHKMHDVFAKAREMWEKARREKDK